MVSIVFALLFGVVQWSASSFSPRLNLFRGDPLVWRTYAFTIGVFVFPATAGLVSGNADRVSLAVPITAVLAVLTTLTLIRALQTRAFLSLQLALVLDAVAGRGREVIGDLYPPRSAAGEPTPAAAPLPSLRRNVSWAGARGVVQQLDLRRLVDAASQADALVVFRVGVGDTLHEAAPLADLHGGDLPDRVVRAAIIRDTERSFDQDPMLAVRLLADIGLRALSPAVNDPATAVDAIDATESLLRALADRQLDIADITDRSGVPGFAWCCPPGRTTCAPGSRICCCPRRRSRWCWSACNGCSPTSSRCPHRRGTPRSSGSAIRVQARLAACRPTPTQGPRPTPIG